MRVLVLRSVCSDLETIDQCGKNALRLNGLIEVDTMTYSILQLDKLSMMALFVVVTRQELFGSR